jgi:hypothetical protein
MTANLGVARHLPSTIVSISTGPTFRRVIGSRTRQEWMPSLALTTKAGQHKGKLVDSLRRLTTAGDGDKIPQANTLLRGPRSMTRWHRMAATEGAMHPCQLTATPITTALGHIHSHHSTPAHITTPHHNLPTAGEAGGEIRFHLNST